MGDIVKTAERNRCLILRYAVVVRGLFLVAIASVYAVLYQSSNLIRRGSFHKCHRTIYSGTAGTSA